MSFTDIAIGLVNKPTAQNPFVDVARNILTRTAKLENPLVYKRPILDDYNLEQEASRIVRAMAQVESGGGQNTVGASGESGFLQFMPETWKRASQQATGTVLKQDRASEIKVATEKVKELLKKGFGAEEIGRIWNTTLTGAQELPLIRKGVNSKGVRFDSEEHGKKVLAAYEIIKKAEAGMKPPLKPLVYSDTPQAQPFKVNPQLSDKRASGQIGSFLQRALDYIAPGAKKIYKGIKTGDFSEYNAGAKEWAANLSTPSGILSMLPGGGGTGKILKKGAQEAVERGFVSSAKEAVPNASKIAGQYVPRSTDELSQKAANLVKEDITAAERMALSGTDDNAVAVSSELLKHYARTAEEAADAATKNALYDKAAEIANTTARSLTEQGRAIQAASILGRLTPEGQVRFAAREILRWNLENPRSKIPELTGKQTDEILKRMQSINKLPDGEQKALKFAELQKYVRDLIPSTWIDKATSVWKAGLLTGLKTTGLNIFANLSHAGTEIAKDIPASATDALLSLVTGKRTLAFTTRGVPKGVAEGAEKGWRYLRTGFDTRDVAAKLDYRQTNFKNKAVQGYVDTVFRLLGAEDQVFYYGALKRSLYNQAIAKAKNAGVKGAERESFVKNLVENPADDMSAYALADAETAVFQNQTVLGQLGKKVQDAAGGAGQFVVPFAKTPSAVAMQVINYSPVGPFKELGQQIAKGQFDQRLFSQAVGRSTIGAGALWVGKELLDKGLMTLDFPKNERERELWKLEGRKANAIKIGDKWRTIQTLGPAGNVMLMGGHFARSMEETGSPTTAMINAAAGTMKSFTEQTFLKGVNDVVAAITDPERSATNVTASYVSSWIPTIINDVAKAIDPKERRTGAETFAQTVLNRLQSRLPVAREGLEPVVTTLGQEQESIGNPLEIMADPTRPSPDTTTPTVAELRRLTDAGFPISPTLLGDKNGYEGLTPEQNTELWKLAGTITDEKLTSLFGLPQYKRLDDEQKAKVTDDVIAKAKVNARAAMVLQLTEGLQGEELKAKLSELKAGGLLTREVLAKYTELR